MSICTCVIITWLASVTVVCCLKGDPFTNSSDRGDPGKIAKAVSSDDENHKASGRIVGAVQRPWANAVPWQVVFLRTGGHDTDVCCGGVLLSNEHILTAAHCRQSCSLSLNGDDRVLVGAKSISETDRIKFLSRRYYVHERYEIFKSARASFSIYDFMILFLFMPLSMHCPTAFVRLPRHDDDTPANLFNKPLTTVGWGLMLPVTHQELFGIAFNLGIYFPNRTPGIMLQIELYYVRKNICQLRWQDHFNNMGPIQGIHPHPQLPGIRDTLGTHYANLLRFDDPSGDSMMCASTCVAENLTQCAHRHERRGVCLGDSGSGLVFVEPNNNPHRIPTLLGITSFVGACGYPEYPDVFGRVTSVLSWIESITQLRHDSHDHLLNGAHQPCFCYE